MVFTFLGTFGPWHGAEVFAQAIQQLVTSDRALLETKNIHFLFVGDGVGMPTVRNTLAAPEFQPFLTLAGLVPQDEAPRILAASDVFVSPHVPNPDGTPFFGSPTKLFEYMSVGRGLIASELDQIGEILRGSPHIRNLASASLPETGCAILTTPGDTEDLKQAILFLIENPSWIDQIGPKARGRVLNQYTWNHHVDAILKALEPALHATDQEKGGSS
jgi:glycosyltransferase involved in cell wall biosynthesis